jgi:hypothetical protein
MLNRAKQAARPFIWDSCRKRQWRLIYPVFVKLNDAFSATAEAPECLGSKSEIVPGEGIFMLDFRLQRLGPAYGHSVFECLRSNNDRLLTNVLVVSLQ